MLATKASEIPVGQMKAVVVQGKPREIGEAAISRGKPLLICHTAEGFYAVDDTCTHDDGSLADGWLDGNAIECPRHGARFDVATGKVLCLPAAVPIPSYPVRLQGDEVQVKV
jgi:3-phenylpropionate/trans-cinnamate dioxygenase ferredoxin subunit